MSISQEGAEQTWASGVPYARDVEDKPAPSIPRRIAIIGVPNSGKSLLFQRLSGKYANSANCPYTTTAIEEAETALNGHRIVLIDTPGITGLEVLSEDEAPTRELLHNEAPDVVLVCMDASNLARSLTLLAKLADMEIPAVVGLNMVDEALARGITIDANALSRELGMPVFPICATDGRGIRKLATGLFEARRPRQVSYPGSLQEKLDRLTPGESRAQTMEQLLSLRHADLKPGQNLWQMIREAHYDWARGVSGRVVGKTGLEPMQSNWEALFRIALHPIGAWLFLLLTVTVVYFLVAQVGVALLADGLDRYIGAPALATVASWTGAGLLEEILVGPFGLLSLGLFNAMFTVLPILGVFYFVFGFLEDVGYFPLLSVQFDRLLRFVGLTGKAVLPITLGFGCNTMATMSTRCLPTSRQRFIACFLISLGIPCSVQLGVMIAILATVPVAAMLGILGIVLALQVIVGLTLARMMPKNEKGEFLIELPPLRPPVWRNVLNKTWHRLKEFFTEACPLFIASAGVLLVLHFTGLLDRIRDLLAPVVVQGFGLPREGADMLLMTLARREVGAVMMKEMADTGQLELRQIFVGLLVMTLFVPCMSNTLLLGRAVGWAKTAVIFVAVTGIAIGAGLVTNALWV